jgi:hypothetical protein
MKGSSGGYFKGLLRLIKYLVPVDLILLSPMPYTPFKIFRRFEGTQLHLLHLRKTSAVVQRNKNKKTIASVKHKNGSSLNTNSKKYVSNTEMVAVVYQTSHITNLNGVVCSKSKIASEPRNNLGKIGRMSVAEVSKNQNSVRIK